MGGLSGCKSAQVGELLKSGASEMDCGQTSRDTSSKYEVKRYLFCIVLTHCIDTFFINSSIAITANVYIFDAINLAYYYKHWMQAQEEIICLKPK